jgi:hypothetical protein
VVVTAVDDGAPPFAAVEAWLDTLASVRGFLVAPSSDMFNSKGQIMSLETLCWTHPDNPGVRWMAPMSTHPVRMQIPEGGVSRAELEGMRHRQRWFYECVRGTTKDTADVRLWNKWVTLCSIALSNWPEGQIKFLEEVVPKDPLKSESACLAHVWSILNPK